MRDLGSIVQANFKAAEKALLEKISGKSSAQTLQILKKAGLHGRITTKSEIVVQTEGFNISVFSDTESQEY